MPKTPTDYSKTIIYKIYCKDETITQTYIGSTTNFTKRKNLHKSECNDEKMNGFNTTKYTFIRENGGWDNFIITPIEEYPCENSTQSRIREQYWIDLQTEKLNAKNAYFNKTEYFENNKDKKKEYDKQYQIDNANKIKQYQIDNADRKKEYNKEYNSICADKIRANKTIYREKNRDKINEYRRKQYMLKKQLKEQNTSTD